VKRQADICRATSTQAGLPTPDSSKRLTVAPTGKVVASGPQDLGLYPLGQMQCVCIAVAIYPTPATLNWTQAWLAHVSSVRHSAVQDIINTFTAANHTQAYVVIAAKHGVGRLDESDQRPVCGRGRCEWREHCAGADLDLFNYRPGNLFVRHSEGWSLWAVHLMRVTG
jgi:hypothetical protein